MYSLNELFPLHSIRMTIEWATHATLLCNQHTVQFVHGSYGMKLSAMSISALLLHRGKPRQYLEGDGRPGSSEGDGKQGRGGASAAAAAQPAHSTTNCHRAPASVASVA